MKTDRTISNDRKKKFRTRFETFGSAPLESSCCANKICQSRSNMWRIWSEAHNMLLFAPNIRVCFMFDMILCTEAISQAPLNEAKIYKLRANLEY